MKRKRMQFVKKALLLAGAALAALAVPAAPASAQVEYYHLDAVGNVRAVTDQDQNVVARHDYLPFGEECTTGVCASNPGIGSDDPRRFTGKERDSETGLDYFGARYYRANSGRFTSVDPAMTIQTNLVEPQRWNRYANSLNNPLRYKDPDGKVAVPAAAWIAAEIGMAIHDFSDAYVTYNDPDASTFIKGATIAGAVLGVATIGGGYGTAAREGIEAASELVLDTNVVISHGKDFVRSGQNVVKSAVTDVELAGLAQRGKISGVPKAADQIPSVGLPGVHTRINVRGELTPGKRGNFADGIIGATAIERGSTLVTSDRALAGAVKKLGGKVVQP